MTTWRNYREETRHESNPHLPHFKECAKQILRNPPPPRANRAFKYHKNPPRSSTLARGGGGVGISIDKCINALQNNEINEEHLGLFSFAPITSIILSSSIKNRSVRLGDHLRSVKTVGFGKILRRKAFI